MKIKYTITFDIETTSLFSPLTEINNLLKEFHEDGLYKAVTDYPVVIESNSLLNEEQEKLLLSTVKKTFMENFEKFNPKYKSFKQNERIINC